MATLTYNGYFGTNAGGTSSAPTGSNNLTTCSSTTGQGIPIGSTVYDVFYSITIQSTKVETNRYHRLYWISVGAYNSGGPSLYPHGSYSSSQRREEKMSSTLHTFMGFMGNNIEGSENWFYNNEITVCAKGNNSGSSDNASTMTNVQIIVYYNEPEITIDTPQISSIKQNNDATFTIDWNDCTGSGGSGSVVYGVFDDTDWNYIRDETNPVYESKYTGNIPEYNTVRKYSVIAYYSGRASDQSDVVETTFYKPSIKDPSSLTINQTSGTSCKISWNAASLNYTEGAITYHIFKDGEEIKTTTSTSYIFDESVVSSWGTNQISLTLKAVATNLTNTASGTSLPSKEIGTVYFTYVPPYKTILRYSGNGPINGYEECIVYYYTGDPNKGIDGWEECEVYRYTGESNATINGWQLCSYT